MCVSFSVCLSVSHTTAHQDVLSEKLCGEGIPDWLVEKGLELVGFNTSDAAVAFPYPLPFDIDIDPATGYPSVDTCMQNGFFYYYMSLESEELWHSIYSEQYMWDAFAVSRYNTTHPLLCLF